MLGAQIEETLKNLRANNFEAEFAESIEAAKQIVLDSISKDAVVGVGDSATIRQIGIVEELNEKGIKILNPFSRELTTDPAKTMVRDDISRRIFSCDLLPEWNQRCYKRWKTRQHRCRWKQSCFNDFWSKKGLHHSRQKQDRERC